MIHIKHTVYKRTASLLLTIQIIKTALHRRLREHLAPFFRGLLRPTLPSNLKQYTVLRRRVIKIFKKKCPHFYRFLKTYSPRSVLPAMKIRSHINAYLQNVCTERLASTQNIPTLPSSNTPHTDTEQLQQRVHRIYFWIASTVQFHRNTGVQRVVRQCARGMLNAGLPLIPVVWDASNARFGPANMAQLDHFSKWNGPTPNRWKAWVAPDPKRQTDWFFMPEWPEHLSGTELSQLTRFIQAHRLHCATIFMDAIPYKMQSFYHKSFVTNYMHYIRLCFYYDLVFPISQYVAHDLYTFFCQHMSHTENLAENLDQKIKPVSLVAEFAENKRIKQVKPFDPTEPAVILCIGTIGPRKNQLKLLHAFVEASKQSDRPLALILAGGDYDYLDPKLPRDVDRFVQRHANITWKKTLDDKALHAHLMACDFTVYPSFEEGFGMPILESLWYAKPCICANHGAMQEVARGGGCLTINVGSVQAMVTAICTLANDPLHYKKRSKEAIARPFISWDDYALTIATHMVNHLPHPPSTQRPATKPSPPLSKKEIRPRLSIGITTYNRAAWLEATLKHWAHLHPTPIDGVEIFVCDNASEDATPTVVEAYQKRSDFTYYRNKKNVGMLGNLNKTVRHAKGQHIWILGDDDFLMPNSLEHILHTLKMNPDIPLLYLNYGAIRTKAPTHAGFETYRNTATFPVPAEPDCEEAVRTLATRTENFFTAIYSLVLRRDHAIKAYTQDTSGRPFSSMQSCIPTTYYVLNHMLDERGIWIGSPMVLVNMNVSWMPYAPLWVLERLPEAYALAEKKGVAREAVDRWRALTFRQVPHYLQVIFENDPLNNATHFSMARLIQHFEHLPAFRTQRGLLRAIYRKAHASGHPSAKQPVRALFHRTVALSEH